jgi:FtsP/CotA-like multicopper oxidase with cupredoxin domain
MRISSKTTVLVVALALGLLASVLSATPATAADRTFTLFGSRAGGWGFSNTSLTSPGPHLEVVLGDNVTLILTSADQFSHDWFIDYDNDGSDDANEPGSPGTFSDTPESWNFTATRNGTYVYQSEQGSDEERMWGLITIHPPGASLPGSGGPPDATTLAIVGLIIAVVAVVALYMLFGRKMGRPRAPPPPPEE